jgi:hypothetical protein
MGGWHQGPMVSLDFESSGLDVENDRIITACIALIDGTGKRPVETIDTIINPAIPIPQAASNIHGWTLDRIQNHPHAMQAAGLLVRGAPAVQGRDPDGIGRAFPVGAVRGAAGVGVMRGPIGTWLLRQRALNGPDPTPARQTAATERLYRDAMAGAGGASPAPAPTETHPPGEQRDKEPVMTTSISDTPDQRRTDIIQGYRRLLDWLEAHAEVPLNEVCNEISYSVLGDDDQSERAEVDRIAAALGVEPSGTVHYEARRAFGPVEYRATAVTSEAMARYQALNSYSGSVQPEPAKAAS